MMRRSERETLFLQYLDALDTGDAEGIQNFLHHAETDPELEAMLMDYHNEQDNPQALKSATERAAPSATWRAFKLKRSQKKRIVNNIATAGIAAVAMIIVGLAGMFLPSWANSNVPLTAGLADAPVRVITATPIPGSTGVGIALNFVEARNLSFEHSELDQSQLPACYGRVLDPDSRITVIRDQASRDDLLLGVNEPFTLQLQPQNTQNNGYDVQVYGITGSIRRSEVEILGDCENAYFIVVYPYDLAARDCDVHYDRQEGFRAVSVNNSTNTITLGQNFEPIFIIMTRRGNRLIVEYQDERYYVNGDDLLLSQDCTAFPILVRP